MVTSKSDIFHFSVCEPIKIKEEVYQAHEGFYLNYMFSAEYRGEKIGCNVRIHEGSKTEYNHVSREAYFNIFKALIKVYLRSVDHSSYLIKEPVQPTIFMRHYHESLHESVKCSTLMLTDVFLEGYAYYMQHPITIVSLFSDEIFDFESLRKTNPEAFI